MDSTHERAARHTTTPDSPDPDLLTSHTKKVNFKAGTSSFCQPYIIPHGSIFFVDRNTGSVHSPRISKSCSHIHT
jgi:hypothetical protein